MVDYIDRDEALNCFTSWIDQYGYPHEPNEIREYEAIAALEDPVIRCDDCKHWWGYTNRIHTSTDSREWDFCQKNKRMKPEDGFCHEAERREE